VRRLLHRAGWRAGADKRLLPYTERGRFLPVFAKWILTGDVSPYFSSSERRKPHGNGRMRQNDRVGLIRGKRIISARFHCSPPTRSQDTCRMRFARSRRYLIFSSVNFIPLPRKEKSSESSGVLIKERLRNAWISWRGQRDATPS